MTTTLLIMDKSRKHPLWANLFSKADKEQEAIDDLWLNTPLFSGISPRHLRSITADLSPRTYQKGEVIFKTGEIGMGAALIVSGSVDIQSEGATLATLKRGDLFGEVALATDETRTADALAAEPTNLVFFMKQDLEDLVKQSPSLAAQLALNLSKVLAVRLRETNVFMQHKESVHE